MLFVAASHQCLEMIKKILLPTWSVFKLRVGKFVVGDGKLNIHKYFPAPVAGSYQSSPQVLSYPENDTNKLHVTSTLQIRLQITFSLCRAINENHFG